MAALMKERSVPMSKLTLSLVTAAVAASFVVAGAASAGADCVKATHTAQSNVPATVSDATPVVPPATTTPETKTGG